MPRHERADAGTPFGERIRIGIRYPFHSAALVTILAATAIESISFVPIGLLRLLVLGIGLVMVYTYAFECLRHTADGFADAPELAINTEGSTVRALLFIQLTGNALVALATFLWGVPGLLLQLLFAFVLPIVTMSLTFDGVGAALNPLTWIAVVARIGDDYLKLFAVALVTGGIQVGAQYALQLRGAGFLGTVAYFLIANYFIVYTFHLMGALIHHRHESLGYAPAADALAEATNPDDDQALLDHVNLIARDDIPGATDILTERIREGIAPAALHVRYRELLRRQDRLPELLVHGQIWIAALVASREHRRALGVVQDCIDVDPAFIPDATATCGSLADTAAAAGMTRLALHLSLGYLRCWPGDMGAPSYGMVAVRMHDRQGDAAEAATLARRLIASYPDHPLRTDIEALLQTLATRHTVPT